MTQNVPALPPLYEWRYQVPTPVAEAEPWALRCEAVHAARRDARHDGWDPAGAPRVQFDRPRRLDDVTEIVVTFPVHRQTRPAVAVLPPPPDAPDEQFDAAPLITLVDSLPTSDSATFGNGSGLLRAYQRGKERGWFSLRDADRLTVHIGHTIETVWTTPHQEFAA